MKCYNCGKNPEKEPIGLLNPLRLFLRDDSKAGERARELIKDFHPNVRLCDDCFWNL